MTGPMTIARERMLRAQGIRVRVFVRGEDVTTRCQFADDTPGSEIVHLIRKTESGRSHIDEGGGLAVEVATSDIEIRLEPLEAPNGGDARSPA